MLDALGSLTTRGRSFLLAGLTALASGWLLGQTALSRVGVLLLVVPLLALWLIRKSHYRLSLERSVQPLTVSVGQPATVSLTLNNAGRTPTGVVLLEDQLPYLLGTRPRFVLEGIRQGWKRHVTYQVTSEVRGRFVVGPMLVRVRDPFGMVELGRSFQSTASLCVTPAAEPLPRIGVGGVYSGVGENRPRSFAFGSPEDVTVREYRQGDDLRRVHWRSSARTGSLMVRREEQPWQARATVFLDNRLLSHRGVGLASSLERAVLVTASVAQHLVDLGFAVRVLTADGPLVDWQARGRGSGSTRILAALAEVELVGAGRINTLIGSAQGVGGVFVAVLGSLLPDDYPALGKLAQQTSERLAVALDVLQWEAQPSATAPDSASVASQLQARNWRTGTLGQRDDIAGVWEGLARRRQSASRALASSGEQP